LHPKKIVLAGILGGILLLATSVIFSAIATMISPYNIFDVPGMRPMSDPVSSLFFAAPFVVAFVSAIVYDIINRLSDGTFRGIVFAPAFRSSWLSLFVVFSPCTPGRVLHRRFPERAHRLPVVRLLCALL
jgi:hypothetical protein